MFSENQSNVSGMLNLVLDEINFRLEELWEYQYIFCRERQNKIKEPFEKFDILLNDIVSDRMKNRNKDNEIKDLLDILISATNDGDSLSLVNMKDQIMTFIGAGHETTSTTLMWIFYELSKHPDILQQLIQEVDGILGTGDNKKSEVSYDDIIKFTYMSQVIKETLRVHPSIPALARVNKEECQFGDYRMHPNTNIVVSLFALHYNKDYWVEPYLFNPDRFHPDKIKETLKHPFQFVSFSAGPRNCIGQRFANMELVVILALFLSNFEISMNDDDFENMRSEETIVLQPRNIWGNFKLRNI
jgi:cytochrome P450